MSHIASRDGVALPEALKAAIAATQNEDYVGALRIFGPLYSGYKIESVSGLSYYALCLAKVERKYNVAVKMCKKAIEAQFYDHNHYINLINVYLAAGSRRKAVETMETGLARLPNDDALLYFRSTMGFRSDPVIRFLHRDNFLNIVLGRARHHRRKRQPREFSVVRTLAWAIPLMVAIFSGVLWWLIHNYM